MAQTRRTTTLELNMTSKNAQAFLKDLQRQAGEAAEQMADLRAKMKGVQNELKDSHGMTKNDIINYTGTDQAILAQVNKWKTYNAELDKATAKQKMYAAACNGMVQSINIMGKKLEDLSHLSFAQVNKGIAEYNALLRNMGKIENYKKDKQRLQEITILYRELAKRTEEGKRGVLDMFKEAKRGIEEYGKGYDDIEGLDHVFKLHIDHLREEKKEILKLSELMQKLGSGQLKMTDMDGLIGKLEGFKKKAKEGTNQYEALNRSIMDMGSITLPFEKTNEFFSLFKDMKEKGYINDTMKSWDKWNEMLERLKTGVLPVTEVRNMLGLLKQFQEEQEKLASKNDTDASVLLGINGSQADSQQQLDRLLGTIKEVGKMKIDATNFEGLNVVLNEQKEIIANSDEAIARFKKMRQQLASGNFSVDNMHQLTVALAEMGPYIAKNSKSLEEYSRVFDTVVNRDLPIDRMKALRDTMKADLDLFSDDPEKYALLTNMIAKYDDLIKRREAIGRDRAAGHIVTQLYGTPEQIEAVKQAETELDRLQSQADRKRVEAENLRSEAEDKSTASMQQQEEHARNIANLEGEIEGIAEQKTLQEQAQTEAMKERDRLTEQQNKDMHTAELLNEKSAAHAENANRLQQQLNDAKAEELRLVQEIEEAKEKGVGIDEESWKKYKDALLYIKNSEATYSDHNQARTMINNLELSKREAIARDNAPMAEVPEELKDAFATVMHFGDDIIDAMRSEGIGKSRRESFAHECVQQLEVGLNEYRKIFATEAFKFDSEFRAKVIKNFKDAVSDYEDAIASAGLDGKNIDGASDAHDYLITGINSQFAGAGGVRKYDSTKLLAEAMGQTGEIHSVESAERELGQVREINTNLEAELSLAKQVKEEFEALHPEIKAIADNLETQQGELKTLKGQEEDIAQQIETHNELLGKQIKLREKIQEKNNEIAESEKQIREAQNGNSEELNEQLENYKNWTKIRNRYYASFDTMYDAKHVHQLAEERLTALNKELVAVDKLGTAYKKVRSGEMQKARTPEGIYSSMRYGDGDFMEAFIASKESEPLQINEFRGQKQKPLARSIRDFDAKDFLLSEYEVHEIEVKYQKLFNSVQYSIDENFKRQVDDMYREDVERLNKVAHEIVAKSFDVNVGEEAGDPKQMESELVGLYKRMREEFDGLNIQTALFKGIDLRPFDEILQYGKEASDKQDELNGKIREQNELLQSTQFLMENEDYVRRAKNQSKVWGKDLEEHGIKVYNGESMEELPSYQAMSETMTNAPRHFLSDFDQKIAKGNIKWLEESKKMITYILKKIPDEAKGEFEELYKIMDTVSKRVNQAMDTAFPTEEIRDKFAELLHEAGGFASEMYNRLLGSLDTNIDKNGRKSYRNFSMEKWEEETKDGDDYAYLNIGHDGLNGAFQLLDRLKQMKESGVLDFSDMPQDLEGLNLFVERLEKNIELLENTIVNEGVTLYEDGEGADDQFFNTVLNKFRAVLEEAKAAREQLVALPEQAPKADTSALESTLQQQRDDLEDLKRQERELDDEIKKGVNLEQQRLDLKGKIKEKEDQIAATTDQLNKANSAPQPVDTSEQKKRLASLRLQMERLSEDIDEQNNLSRGAADSAKALIEQWAEGTDLANKLKKSVEDLGAADTELGRIQGQLNDKQNTLEEMRRNPPKGNTDDYDAQIQAIEDEVKTLQDAADAQQKVVENARNAVSAMTQQGEALKLNKDAMREMGDQQLATFRQTLTEQLRHMSSIEDMRAAAAQGNGQELMQYERIHQILQDINDEEESRAKNVSAITDLRAKELQHMLSNPTGYAPEELARASQQLKQYTQEQTLEEDQLKRIAEAQQIYENHLQQQAHLMERSRMEYQYANTAIKELSDDGIAKQMKYWQEEINYLKDTGAELALVTAAQDKYNRLKNEQNIRTSSSALELLGSNGTSGTATTSAQYQEGIRLATQTMNQEGMSDGQVKIWKDVITNATVELQRLQQEEKNAITLASMLRDSYDDMNRQTLSQSIQQLEKLVEQEKVAGRTIPDEITTRLDEMKAKLKADDISFAEKVLGNTKNLSTAEINEAIKITEEQAKQLGDTSSHEFRKFIHDINEAKREMEQFANAGKMEMMSNQLRHITDLSREALTSQLSFWKGIRDNAASTTEQIEKAKGKIDELNGTMKSRGEISASYYKEDGELVTKGSRTVAETREDIQNMKALLETYETGSEKAKNLAVKIQSVEKSLRASTEAKKNDAKENIDWADAIAEAAQIENDSFTGTIQRIEDLKKSLEVQLKDFHLGIDDDEIKKTQHALDVINGKIKQLRNNQNSADNSSTKLRLSQKELQKILASPKDASYKDLKVALEQVKQEIADIDPKKADVIGIYSGKAKMGKDAIIEYSRAVRDLSKAVKDQKPIMEASATTLENAFSRLKSYVMIYMGFQAVWTRVQNLISKNFELSDSIANVQKVSGLTKEQVDKLSDSLQNLQSRVGAIELMQIAYQGSKMGVAVEGGRGALLQFTEAANKLNSALGEDFGGAEAIGKLTKLAQVMHITGQANQELNSALEKTGSAILTLGNNSTASYSYIQQFASRLGGIASTANIAMPDLLAIGSTLDTMQMPAEMAATAMTKFIATLSKKPDQMAKTLQMTGEILDTFNASIDAGDTMTALTMVFKQLHDNKADLEDVANVLKDLVGGGNNTRALQVITSMANGYETLVDHVRMSNDAFEDGTAIAKEYDITNETAAASLKRMGNALTNVFMNSGMSNAMGKFMKGMADTFEYLQQNLHTFMAIIGAIAIRFTNFADIFTTIRMAWTGLSSQVILNLQKMKAHYELEIKNGIFVDGDIQLNLFGKKITLFTGQTVTKFRLMGVNCQIAIAKIVAAITKVGVALKSLTKSVVWFALIDLISEVILNLNKIPKIIKMIDDAEVEVGNTILKIRQKWTTIYEAFKKAEKGTNDYRKLNNAFVTELEKFISKEELINMQIIDQKGNIIDLAKAYEVLTEQIIKSERAKAGESLVNEVQADQLRRQRDERKNFMKGVEQMIGVLPEEDKVNYNAPKMIEDFITAANKMTELNQQRDPGTRKNTNQLMQDILYKTDAGSKIMELIEKTEGKFESGRGDYTFWDEVSRRWKKFKAQVTEGSDAAAKVDKEFKTTHNPAYYLPQLMTNILEGSNVDAEDIQRIYDTFGKREFRISGMLGDIDYNPMSDGSGGKGKTDVSARIVKARQDALKNAQEQVKAMFSDFEAAANEMYSTGDIQLQTTIDRILNFMKRNQNRVLEGTDKFVLGKQDANEIDTIIPQNVIDMWKEQANGNETLLSALEQLNTNRDNASSNALKARVGFVNNHYLGVGPGEGPGEGKKNEWVNPKELARLMEEARYDVEKQIAEAIRNQAKVDAERAKKIRDAIMEGNPLSKVADDFVSMLDSLEIFFKNSADWSEQAVQDRVDEIQSFSARITTVTFEQFQEMLAASRNYRDLDAAEQKVFYDKLLKYRDDYDEAARKKAKQDLKLLQNRIDSGQYYADQLVSLKKYQEQMVVAGQVGSEAYLQVARAIEILEKRQNKLVDGKMTTFAQRQKKQLEDANAMVKREEAVGNTEGIGRAKLFAARTDFSVAMEEYQRRQELANMDLVKVLDEIDKAQQELERAAGDAEKTQQAMDKLGVLQRDLQTAEVRSTELIADTYDKMLEKQKAVAEQEAELQKNRLSQTREFMDSYNEMVTKFALAGIEARDAKAFELAELHAKKALGLVTDTTRQRFLIIKNNGAYEEKWLNEEELIKTEIQIEAQNRRNEAMAEAMQNFYKQVSTTLREQLTRGMELNKQRKQEEERQKMIQDVQNGSLTIQANAEHNYTSLLKSELDARLEYYHQFYNKLNGMSGVGKVNIGTPKAGAVSRTGSTTNNNTTNNTTNTTTNSTTNNQTTIINNVDNSVNTIGTNDDYFDAGNEVFLPKSDKALLEKLVNRKNDEELKTKEANALMSKFGKTIDEFKNMLDRIKNNAATVSTQNATMKEVAVRPETPTKPVIEQRTGGQVSAQTFDTDAAIVKAQSFGDALVNSLSNINLDDTIFSAISTAYNDKEANFLEVMFNEEAWKSIGVTLGLQTATALGSAFISKLGDWSNQWFTKMAERQKASEKIYNELTLNKLGFEDVTGRKAHRGQNKQVDAMVDKAKFNLSATQKAADRIKQDNAEGSTLYNKANDAVAQAEMGVYMAEQYKKHFEEERKIYEKELTKHHNIIEAQDKGATAEQVAAAQLAYDKMLDEYDQRVVQKAMDAAAADTNKQYEGKKNSDGTALFDMQAYMQQKAINNRASELSNTGDWASAFKNLTGSDYVSNDPAIAATDSNTTAITGLTEAVVQNTAAVTGATDGKDGADGANGTVTVKTADGKSLDEADKTESNSANEYVALWQAAYKAKDEARMKAVEDSITSNKTMTDDDKKNLQIQLTNQKTTNKKIEAAEQNKQDTIAALQTMGASTSTAVGEMVAAASGNQMMGQLTAGLAQAGANVLLGIATGTANSANQGWWMPAIVMPILTALLGAALGAATSKVKAAKSQISSATGASSGKLTTGMLTYATGKYVYEDEKNSKLKQGMLAFADGYTPGQSYSVDGADGNSYNAKYAGSVSDLGTGIQKGTHFGIFSEVKPEMVIDGDTTKLMHDKYPMLENAILTLHRTGSLNMGEMLGLDYNNIGKTIQTLTRSHALSFSGGGAGFKMATFAEGSYPYDEASMSRSIDGDTSGYRGLEASQNIAGGEALQQLNATLAMLQETLAGGISATMSTTDASRKLAKQKRFEQRNKIHNGLNG